MKATRFTIDRSKWARGNESETFLCHPVTGRMCCLGFFAKACGIDPDDFKGRGEYDELNKSAAARLPGDLVIVPVHETCPPERTVLHRAPERTVLHRAIVSANDDYSCTDQEREDKLTGLFASIGVTVDFVDGTP